MAIFNKALFLILLFLPSFSFATSYSIQNGKLITVDSSGNIGIGTNIPGSPLQVKGRTFMSALGANPLVFDLNGTNFGILYNKPADSTLFFGGATAITSTPTTSLLALDFDTSNVGIGTDQPLKTLDIVGTLQATGHVKFEGVTSTGATGTGKFVYDGTPTLVTPVLGVATATSLSTSGNVGVGTIIASNGFLSVTNTGSGNTVYIEDQAADPTPFVIDASGLVGIGTLSPFNLLDVSKSGAGIQNTIYSSNYNAPLVDVGSRLLFVGNGGSANGGIGGAWEGGATTDGYVNIYTRGSSNTTEKVRVTSAGNVGIGTITPGGKLIVSSGNVGIGTVTPQSTLTIGGNGHLGSTGTAPTVANNDCGSTSQGAATVGSTDLRGDVTVGTLNVTSCAVTFATPFGRAPRCVVNDDTTILTVKAVSTTTKLTITSTTSMSIGPDVITWICVE